MMNLNYFRGFQKSQVKNHASKKCFFSINATPLSPPVMEKKNIFSMFDFGNGIFNTGFLKPSKIIKVHH